MSKVKAFQIGCGRMSKYIMKYIYDLGGTIVGAVDTDYAKVGKDIGTIMETDNKGVIIEHVSSLEELLKETKPNIAVITTMSFLNDVEDNIRICARSGINVITTSEECFYAENSNQSTFHELDVLAKANNITITGCGYQDAFWGNMVTVLAGSIHNIKKIKGSSSYNVEDYGIALAEAHGAGLAIEDFNKSIVNAYNITEEEEDSNPEKNPSYMWNTVGWLADKMNLTPKKLTQKCVPIIADEEINSNTLNMTIEEGYVTGMSAIATLETKEGITIEAECIGKVYGPNDFDKNEWTIEGEPTTTFTVNRPNTVELTCADIANRIPDVIASNPGFIPTCKIGEITYKLNY